VQPHRQHRSAADSCQRAGRATPPARDPPRLAGAPGPLRRGAAGHRARGERGRPRPAGVVHDPRAGGLRGMAPDRRGRRLVHPPGGPRARAGAAPGPGAPHGQGDRRPLGERGVPRREARLVRARRRRGV
ncbi:MAG: Uncharacterized protein with histidine kinase-like ATPase domain, partial [uncultured Blastococcus sp.]